MDRLVVSGNKIIDYNELLKKNVTEFINITKILEEEKEKLLWESDNYDKMMILYDKMIDDYYLYTKRMTDFSNYLNRLINRNEESLNIIKKDYYDSDYQYRRKEKWIKYV